MKAKVQKIGNSLGVILPKEVLARHHINEGDALTMSEGPGSIHLSIYNDEIEEELAIGEAFMSQYKETFRALAK
jgi:putative addiction module antidote